MEKDHKPASNECFLTGFEIFGGQEPLDNQVVGAMGGYGEDTAADDGGKQGVRLGDEFPERQVKAEVDESQFPFGPGNAEG